jgi:hypothetical protein
MCLTGDTSQWTYSMPRVSVSGTIWALNMADGSYQPTQYLYSTVFYKSSDCSGTAFTLEKDPSVYDNYSLIEFPGMSYVFVDRSKYSQSDSAKSWQSPPNGIHVFSSALSSESFANFGSFISADSNTGCKAVAAGGFGAYPDFTTGTYLELDETQAPESLGPLHWTN